MTESVEPPAAPSGSIPAPRVGQTAQRIGFRRHLRAEVVAGEAAYLFSERGVTALAGPLVAALAPLLDGTRDLPTVLRELPGELTSDEVGQVVNRLIDAGLVRPWSPTTAGTTGDATAEVEAYWDTSGLNPMSAVAGVSSARLSLLAAGDLTPATTAAARGALEAAGLAVSARPQGPADLSVVLCTDYLSPDLAEIDATHRATGRPWLLAKPVGATVWVGPIFQPGHGCWHCLAVRLEAHRQAEGYVQAALGRSGPAARSAVSVPPLTATAMHVIALEAVKWLAGHRYHGQQCVWTFDSFDLRGRHHELRARPQCVSCGDPTLVGQRAQRPVVLRPRRKISYGGGGHRSMTPEQVLDTYRHLVSPVTGVIKEIGRDRRGPSFFNSYRSGPNVAAAGVRSLKGLRSALRTANGGKGITPLHAEVSALCEALERHCANFHGDEARVRGSLRSIGERAVHPNTCQLYAERQYESRVQWNSRHAPFQYVCAPFDEDAVLDWTPVWSLTEGRHRLLPTAMLYFGAPVPPGPWMVRADSNGNAAGSSLEDAVLQGLLELVERDAVALWWYNRTRAPEVDLDSFGDPWITELRQVHAELGRDVWVLDITSDLQVPTMVALSRRTNSPYEGIVFGFGAHPDPLVALRRSLTELNQLMPTVIDAGADGRFGVDGDPDATHWFRHATVANQPYLVPDPAVWPRRPADFEYQPRTDLVEEVRSVQTRLEALGMQVLVLDQTRPDIALPVVKVIVPGLRHFWARFAPGRLFDVPVRLGRLTEPRTYEELNPIPLFV